MNIYCVLSICCILLDFISSVLSFRCDRRPYGSTTQASVSDGRYNLKILDAEDKYIPEQLYTVQITQTDDTSQFMAFMISAEGDLKPDPEKPRRMMLLSPGVIRPKDASVKFSERCLYSVEQTASYPRSSVEVYWLAPPSGNGCVTLRAMVEESKDIWFEDGSPLSLKVCEDMSQPDDVSPKLNLECSICDEAKYEVSFTGIWSRNTHPPLYPENDWVPKFSDLIGVSHTADFIMWAPGSLATEGFKDFAEFSNSSKLEVELKEKIGDGVRTIIKGKGHGYRKMAYTTYAFFRADSTNHLVTAAISLHPSPDWFLGVNRFELCQSDNTWLKERELKLYPWDAGTDSGVSYESPNMKTVPQDDITRVEMSTYDKNSPFYEVNMKDLHPFGKLNIKLIRTYHRDCEEETDVDEETVVKEEGDENEPVPNESEPDEPSRYQNAEHEGGDKPLEVDPDSPTDCPMTEWQEWSNCDGDCENGVLKGYQYRQRYHLVDNIAVDKYDPATRNIPKKEVSEYCRSKYEDYETVACEEDCSKSNEEVEVQRRVMTPIAPGNEWTAKKRDLKS